LPKRIPSVLSAEEMNGFSISWPGRDNSRQAAGRLPKRAPCAGDIIAGTAGRAESFCINEEGLLLRRDRALLELLYAAGLRVSELTGLNLADMDQKERILRVRGKGRKERIVPYGAKAQDALEKYWPLREQLLCKRFGRVADRSRTPKRSFLNYSGRRLTPRSVGRILKKYVRIANVNWDLHPHSLRHAFATHCSPTEPIFAPFRNFSAINHSPPHRNTPTPPSAS